MKPTRTLDRDDINEEAKLLALDYIYYKLRTKGDYIWYQCPTLPDPQRHYLVMRELGDEFERRYAETFGDMMSTLKISEFTTYKNFLQVCNELFRGDNLNYLKVDGDVDVKWSRIVALFAFGGILAVECKKHDLTDRLNDIADWIYIYVRNHLSYWIFKHGGWDGLCEYYETRMMNKEWETFKKGFTVASVCGAVGLAYILARHFH